jgi:hypothetical protein
MSDAVSDVNRWLSEGKRVFTDALEREQLGQGSEICADIIRR